MYTLSEVYWMPGITGKVVMEIDLRVSIQIINPLVRKQKNTQTTFCSRSI